MAKAALMRDSEFRDVGFLAFGFDVLLLFSIAFGSLLPSGK